MPEKDDDELKNFRAYENEESTLKEQKLEKNHRDLVRKCPDIKSRATNGLSGHTPEAGLLISELSSSLKKIRFGKQKFSTSKLVSDIKYHH